MPVDNRLAPGWDAEAHRHWLAGNRDAAIGTLLSRINACPGVKPLPLVLQLVYYVFLIGDYRAVAGFLERVRADYPRNVDLLTNLGVAYSRSGDHARAAECMRAVLSVDPNIAVAHDSLANSLSAMGNLDEARHAGTRALVLKDAAGKAGGSRLHPPASGPARWLAARSKPNVISFSLWGGNPRYLRGAIDNALAAPAIYPDWHLRYHVDTTVPADVQAALRGLGAEVILEAADQPIRERLAWRFKVANDPDVGRFLVRDADSVLNEREAWAVAQWIASDVWFHAMRDWWTHTDLLLAGMWGGVAGILPGLGAMLRRYKSPTMETLNIDQHFLRDQIWPLVRNHCLVHDRCFSAPGTRRWDLPDPAGNTHVGQDVFTARHAEQELRLGAWIENVPSLRLPPA